MITVINNYLFFFLSTLLFTIFYKVWDIKDILLVIKTIEVIKILGGFRNKIFIKNSCRYLKLHYIRFKQLHIKNY